MKKKLLLILLCGVCLLGLTGCGADTKAKVTDLKGNKSLMSAKDLMKVYDGNEAKFDKYYVGAKVTFTGTVESIDTNTSVILTDAEYTGKNRIIFKEGWCLALEEDTEYDLADFDVGDKLTVTTGIVNAPESNDKGAFRDLKRCVWLAGFIKPNKINTKITKK